MTFMYHIFWRFENVFMEKRIWTLLVVRVHLQHLGPELQCFLKDLYSCIFNIIRLGTKHKKTY